MRGEQVELPSELERKQARNSGKFNEAVDMIDGYFSFIIICLLHNLFLDLLPKQPGMRVASAGSLETDDLIDEPAEINNIEQEENHEEFNPRSSYCVSDTPLPSLVIPL